MYRLCLLVALATFITGCDTTLGTQARTDQLPTIRIPGAPIPSALQISLGAAIANPPIDLGSASSFVTFVRVRNMTLNILDTSELDSNDDGAEDSFDFLTGLSIFIRANFNGTTNELLIATLPDGDPQFGTAARELVLTVVARNDDVLDYLEASGGYDVVLRLSGSVPADDVLISGAIRYRIGIGFT